jgi:hypothetical protein
MHGSEANRELIMTLVLWPAQIAIAQVLLRLDEKRLTPTELERAWLPVTRDLMTFMLGPLCLPIHALRTRVHGLPDALLFAKSLARGLLWSVLGIVVGFGVLMLLEYLASLVLDSVLVDQGTTTALLHSFCGSSPRRC